MGLTALPMALLAGLLRERLARVHVGELVVHLEQTSPGELRDELALALDDRTLEVAFWLPEQHEYVDAAGSSVPMPIDGPDRAVTESSTTDSRLRFSSTTRCCATSKSSSRGCCGGTARARQRPATCRGSSAARDGPESRARIVTAADEERRRIERDLHDGAQQRLVALALELRGAQRRLGEGSDPEMDPAARVHRGRAPGGSAGAA